MNVSKTRYALLLSFIVFFVSLSFVVRIILTCFSWRNAGLSIADLFTVFLKGFVFDMAVAFFLCAAYSLYLLILPEKFNRSLLNRVLTYIGFFLVVLICMFSFFAEITFWKEFDSRFNFIAVDYLVYTYEVVNNINESYPLPYLIGGMLLATMSIILLLEIRKVFKYTFTSPTSFKTRACYTGTILLGTIVFALFTSNDWAEQDANRYKDELSKAGIFSFFAAFKNNELEYDDFYLVKNTDEIFETVKTGLFDTSSFDTARHIRRKIIDPAVPLKPNVIMITIESFSADFMKSFGNTNNLTPVLDSIANSSVLFTNMYATGTRTVRGMEALSLSIPPTPGNSIVRRKNNEGLFSVGSVFKEMGYTRTFFYGGDGYFDNMNAFFGNNGFDIVDHGNKLIPGEHFTGKRTRIPGDQVHFENAWGICDEDLYDAVIRDADIQHGKGQAFYDFVMTTSNHRPYTYPAGKIDIAPGTGRDGAVKYTDYAIGEFIKKIKAKPWFDNTIIIFIADHCASVAGKDEINVAHYLIPCMIYNLKGSQPFTIQKQCSQIDLYPTLFGLLHWSYTSNFYGNDVLQQDYYPRAFVGTYQKLGYLTRDTLVILSPGRKSSQYLWNQMANEQKLIEPGNDLIDKAISYYQSANYLFKHGGLKE